MSAAFIPIANLYYLLCYAWDRLAERDLVLISEDSSPELADLFGRILVTGVGQVLKRGVAQRYLSRSEEIPGVRGRLDLSESIKQNSFARGTAVCAYDELSPDSLENRVIRSTLRRLAQIPSLDPMLVLQLRELFRRLPEVSDITLNETVFKTLARRRKRGVYGLLLDVCEMVHRNTLPDEKSGAMKFKDFVRDDKQMAALFERFLLKFFATEQRQYRVSSRQLNWRAVGLPEQLVYVPTMRTDVYLENGEHTIVIDAKYYGAMLSERFGKETVRASHLYQLFSYMHHVHRRDAGDSVSGVLIYPKTSQALQVNVELSGFPVKAVAIDLTQPWRLIRADLLALISIASVANDEVVSSGTARRR